MESKDSGRKGIFQLSLAEIAFIILLFLTLLLGLRISYLTQEIKDSNTKYESKLLLKDQTIKELNNIVTQLKESNTYKFDSYASSLCKIDNDKPVTPSAPYEPCIKCLEKTTGFSNSDAKLALEMGRELILLQQNSNSSIITKDNYFELIIYYARQILNNENLAQQQALGQALLQAFEEGYRLKQSQGNSSGGKGSKDNYSNNGKGSNNRNGNGGKAFSDEVKQEDYDQAFEDYFNQMKKLGEAVASDDKIAYVDKGEPGANTKQLLYNLDQIYKENNQNLSFDDFSRDVRACASGIAKGKDLLTVNREDYQKLKDSAEQAKKEAENLSTQLISSRKKANYLQGRLSKSGFGYPPCWIPEEGETTRYIIKVTVNSPNSVTVVPAWPDEKYKAKAERIAPIMKMIALKNMSMSDFLALGQEVNNNYIGKGTEDECRYFVILDNNRITDRKQADLARYRVSSLFYIYETR